MVYLAGALEVGGVGLDELVGVDILHRPHRRSCHPVAATAAGRGGEREMGAARGGALRLLRARVLWRRGWGGGAGIYIRWVWLRGVGW